MIRSGTARGRAQNVMRSFVTHADQFNGSSAKAAQKWIERYRTRAGGWDYQVTGKTGERWFNKKLGVQLRISTSHRGEIRLYAQYLDNSGPAAEISRGYLTGTWSPLKP
jgi:hypothetical protein